MYKYCGTCDKMLFIDIRNNRKESTYVDLYDVASLQLLSRINVNNNVNDRRLIDRLNIPQIIKKWLDEYYDMDNSYRRLAQKFNAKAHSEGSKLKMCKREMVFAGRTIEIETTWHLQDCKRNNIYCMCNYILKDPSCIFENTPSQILLGEREWYFGKLGWKNGTIFNLKTKKHFCFTPYVMCDCVKSRAIRNPEHFFRIPLEDRFKLPTESEIQELKKEWKNAKDNVRKFNIVCRVLGKILAFIKTEDGYHLNNCGYYCKCKIALETPETYFVLDVLNENYIIRDEITHLKDCARLKILCNPYKKFPKNFDCHCNSVNM